MTWDPPVPPVSAGTEPWWAATRSKELRVQRCEACGAFQHYPRAMCRTCGATEMQLVQASGRGTVASYTVVHRSPDPERFEAPYVLALIRLEEGPMLLTRLTGMDDARCDEPVEVGWKPLGDGRHLPVFSRPTRREAK